MTPAIPDELREAVAEVISENDQTIFYELAEPENQHYETADAVLKLLTERGLLRLPGDAPTRNDINAPNRIVGYDDGGA